MVRLAGKLQRGHEICREPIKIWSRGPVSAFSQRDDSSDNKYLAVRSLQSRLMNPMNLKTVRGIYIILVPRALLTRGQQSATRGSGQIHIKLASDWPQRNIWFIVNMNKKLKIHKRSMKRWFRFGENWEKRHY